MESRDEYNRRLRDYMKARRERRRQEMRKLLGGKCARCDETNDLEFDHVDRTEKSGEIASMLDAPMGVLVAEVGKCQLLCKRHHLEKGREAGDVMTPTHGNYSMHRRHGCRCKVCVDWYNAYTKEYRRRRALSSNPIPGRGGRIRRKVVQESFVAG